MKSTFKHFTVIGLFFFVIACHGQNIICPNHVIYFTDTSGFIVGYDPDLPVSSSNPISTGIPNPPGLGLTLMPSINGGTFSPTFYSGQGNYFYWNGSAWIDTGHSTGSINAINIGGCGGYIYNMDLTVSPISIYTYNGTTNSSLLIGLPNNAGVCGDIVTDCNCNLYILNPVSPNPYLTKYSPQGVPIVSYSLMGLPNTSGGPGFAIMGNDVYYPIGTIWYKGVIGPGLSISFSMVPNSMNGPFYDDFASCPASPTISSVSGTLNTSGIICPGQTANIVATTTNAVTYSWAGPAIVGSLNSPSVAVNSPGVYSCTMIANNCGQSQLVQTITVNNTAIAPTFSLTGKQVICKDQSSTLNALSSTSQGVLTYSWIPINLSAMSVTVSPNVTTVYTVTAKDLNGCTATNTIQVIVDACVGVVEQSTNKILTVYPNPNSGKFNIETDITSASSVMDFTIYDQLGTMVLSGCAEIGRQMIDITPLSNGIYFMEIKNTDAGRVLKLIKTD